jgi:phage FluMu protein Com
MPIQFRCSKCGKLLRTGDDTAGRQAQCPECGTISTVPSSAPPPGSAVPPPVPLEGSTPFASGSPFAEAAGAESPYRLPDSLVNQSLQGPLDLDAAQRVSGPAMALLVTGIINLLAHLAFGGLYAVVIVMALNGKIEGQKPAEMVLGGGIMIALALFGVVMDIIVLMGAVKMKNLGSYSFAMASAIIAMIPFFSPCCILGLPFGIWAIVVLGDSSVKAAFRR